MDDSSSASVQGEVFPGTAEERDQLFAAVANNCACAPASPDSNPGACAPHGLLLVEPTLKRLVFFRRWHRAQRGQDTAAID